MLFKRFFIALSLFACFNAKAQLFTTGSLGIGYASNLFQVEAVPGVGYEINDKWAVGLSLGVSTIGKDIFGVIDPYVRYTFFNKGAFSFDVKGKAGGYFSSVSIISFGAAPSIRYEIDKKWQIAADFGLIGIQMVDEKILPAFLLTSGNVQMSAIYKF